MQIQSNLQPTSESAYPIEDSTLSTPVPPEKLVNPDSVIACSAWRETGSARLTAAEDSNLADISMAGTASIGTHSPIASFESGNAGSLYHKLSPLRRQELSNTMHLQSPSNQSNMHHGTADTEASVLAPQMVLESYNHSIIK